MSLNIINKSPEDLIGYERNNKKHNKKQIDLLANSIKEYWFNSPVIIDSNNIIIAWHGRIEAAIKLWLKEVPTIVKDDLTVEQIKKYRLLDNKIAELATDDIDNIKMELIELWDIELWELYWIQLEIDWIDLDEDREDEIPTIKKKVYVKRWDIFQLWKHRLMCWDSTNKDDVNKLMDWVKADMVFTDPPYNIGYKDMKWSFDKIKNDKMSDEDFIKFLKDSLYTDSKTQYICCSWQYVHLFRQAMEEMGLPVKAFIVWNKVNPAQNLDKYYKCHEIILYTGKFGGQKTLRWDVWECKRQRNTVHPTMKPIELIETALNDNKATIVYDWFWWSWSTLIASEKTNRKCFMMELDEHYIQVIIKRYHQYTAWQKDIKCLNREVDIDAIIS